LRFGSARIETSIDSCTCTYVSMDTASVYSLFENVGYKSQGDLHRVTRIESDRRCKILHIAFAHLKKYNAIDAINYVRARDKNIKYLIYLISFNFESEDLKNVEQVYNFLKI